MKSTESPVKDMESIMINHNGWKYVEQMNTNSLKLAKLGMFQLYVEQACTDLSHERMVKP